MRASRSIPRPARRIRSRTAPGVRSPSGSADFGGEYGLAVTDQRDRAVFNGIWQAAGGFQVSGVYFYGSGERHATSYGGDQRGIGATGSARLRPNGTIVPRNAFVGQPVHCADLRFQQSLRLAAVAQPT